ncbi:MAG: helix-turn-helix domain-containing protein, partial [Acidobacteriota bacterium]
PPEAAARQPAEITREALVAALDESRWTVKQAAARLGIGRTSMYDLMRRHGLRTTRELTAAEVTLELESAGGELEAAARALGVSRPGLVMRMKQLGLR